MGTEIKALFCPQCGSPDVKMTGDGQGVCNACGSQFTVQQTFDTQNIFNEIHVHMDETEEEQNGFMKARINPECSKEEFLRKAWIALYKEDAPIEVFSEDFEEVTEQEHQVAIEYEKVDVPYQASIGYDRQEPYIDYETYYEDEPYMTTERKYDSAAKSYYNVPVTKYKRVPRQRPVTRYKTVTDWSPVSGTRNTITRAITELLPDVALVDRLYWESRKDLKQTSLSSLPEDVANAIEIGEKQLEALSLQHKYGRYTDVEFSLPGNHHRDVVCKAPVIRERCGVIECTVEYKTSIQFKGQAYEKYAFPFGNMTVGGSRIENAVSPKAVTEKMEKEAEQKKQKRLDAVEKNIWNKTKKFSFLTMALLVLSIAISCFVRVSAINIAAIALAIVMYIFRAIREHRNEQQENAAANAEVQAEMERVHREIEHYAENYKRKQRQALDDKLQALGLAPVTADEL